MAAAVSFRFRLLSDLHLEFRTKHFDIDSVLPDLLAPNLILAGDIGKPLMPNYHTFLDNVSQRYKHVFLVLGNHEYWNVHHGYDEILQRTRDLTAQWPNIHFLEKDTYDFPEHDLTVAGCTLWTHIAPENRSLAASGMNDYGCIRRYNPDMHMLRNVTPTMTSEWHEESVEWLSGVLQESAETESNRVLVVTHHMPLIRLTGNSDDDLMTCCYGTDLAELRRHPRMALWCHGHTHYGWRAKSEYEDKYVICNPVGTPRDSHKSGYDKTFVWEI